MSNYQSNEIKLINTSLIDPFPNGFTDALTSWNEHSGSRKEYEKISGIAAEDAPRPRASACRPPTGHWKP